MVTGAGTLSETVPAAAPAAAPSSLLPLCRSTGLRTRGQEVFGVC